MFRIFKTKTETLIVKLGYYENYFNLAYNLVEFLDLLGYKHIYQSLSNNRIKTVDKYKPVNSNVVTPKLKIKEFTADNQTFEFTIIVPSKQLKLVKGFLKIILEDQVRYNHIVNIDKPIPQIIHVK